MEFELFFFLVCATVFYFASQSPKDDNQSIKLPARIYALAGIVVVPIYWCNEAVKAEFGGGLGDGLGLLLAFYLYYRCYDYAVEQCD